MTMFGLSRLGGRMLAKILALIALCSTATAQSQGSFPKSAPRLLEDTGLYSDFGSLKVDPRNLLFSPQYPLWSDGATKRRWISLPPDTAIDAGDPDAWVFPVGTRLWKEFSFGGRRVETRYLERLSSGEWLYAAYQWDPDGLEAKLVSNKGLRGAYPLKDGRSHTIPSVGDCKVCHQGSSTEVLGFGTVQLSHDRDPNAVHAEILPAPGIDLHYLVNNGLLVGLPRSYLERPPRIEASNATERAALGYLHGNCGHCHNEEGSLANLGLFLRQPGAATPHRTISGIVGFPVRRRAPGQPPEAVLRIKPRYPDESGLLTRMASRYPPLQMPPLGTELVDEEAVSLIRRWIGDLDEARNDFQKGEER